jgi:lysophospholipase L1-like esterase
VISVSLLEVAACLIYFYFLPEANRGMLESNLGINLSQDHPVLFYKPHPYFNFTCNPDYQYPDGYKPHNSKGFRMPEWLGSKEKGTVRIVALGASTTYGMFSKDGGDYWPALLEEELRKIVGSGIEVINLGVPYYTVYEIIGVAAMIVPSLEPDIVLIHVGANDSFCACYPEEGGPDNTRFRFSWNYQPLPETARLFMRKSYFARLLGYKMVLARGYPPGDMAVAIQYPIPAEGDVLKNFTSSTGRYFERNIRTLVTLCRNTGALPVLLTHPLNPGWENPDSKIYRSVVKAHKRNNEIIMRTGGEMKVPVVDLYSAMKDPRFYIDALHESARGTRIKTNLIIEAVQMAINRINGRLDRSIGD